MCRLAPLVRMVFLVLWGIGGKEGDAATGRLQIDVGIA
jgi:hypothetical protein